MLTFICITSIDYFTPISDFKATIPVTSIQGDIRNLEDFSAAIKGADCVIHIAGIISIGTHPNVKAMKAINVDGKNLTLFELSSTGISYW